LTVPNKSILLEASWHNRLEDEFAKEYFLQLSRFIHEEEKEGKIVYPTGNQIFKALDLCPFDAVKVVIIGQDPYHGPNQANGLSFSVNHGAPLPPSLKNIFTEIKSDLGFDIPSHGDLTKWAHNGVLLLNASLTVEAHKPGSHQSKGWELFTDAIINLLNQEKVNLVFMLWGGYAHKKGSMIDPQKHLVLQSGHPSPLSANRGYWFGNKHFSKCNAFLISKHLDPIKWAL
jgi:uracil-DNA glycosylase